MKTPSKFTIYDLRFTIGKKSHAAANHQSSIVNHKSTSGVALVITLILLSVTLIMAVAFLAVARRERNAVTTTTDTTIARLATDAALAAAEAQIAANIFSGNPYNFGLLVSTNILPADYPTNYPFSIGNSQPRPPVFVSTNGGLDFRFYLDLNRNGKYDANGWVTEVDNTGANTSNTVFEVGDPEWIGVLERPDANPTNNNKFIARYAFFAQPVGNGLDLNYIHNQAVTKAVDSSYNTPSPPSDGFLRNQGLGSWELNLAAFLADLNTNQWDTIGAPYLYQQGLQPAFPNSGNAFSDALSLLSYRYNYIYGNLASANNYLANTTNYPFNIDLYSDGPLQTTVDFSATPPGDSLNASWAGADNPNRFFALPSDLFDPTKVGASFTNHLAAAGTSTSTYDNYTFYRLLSQLGTDSTADDGRMNLNYDNLDAGGNVIVGAETNLIAWTPLRFFTNAANRLLTNATTTWLAANFTQYTNTFGATTTYAFGVTNIPVYVNGQFVYTPAVNRLLQLAANMYDSSTNSPYPSVFRPTFNVVNQGGSNNVYINGYQQVVSVTGTIDPQLAQPTNVQALVVGTYNNQNVYGVPWIIGAKKGLPNFNQFSMLTAVQVTRKLKVTKPTLAGPITTNQMYEFSITNLLGCSLWNSYTSAYSGTINIVARDNITMLLTNDAPGFSPLGLTNYLTGGTYSNSSWTGTLWANVDPSVTELNYHSNSFVIPFSYANGFLPEAIYRYAGYPNYPNSPYPGFDIGDTNYQTTATANIASQGLTPPLPHFGLVITNRLQVFVLNGTNVIDYVQFAGPEGYVDINTNLADPDSTAFTPTDFWSTNGYNGGTTPWGVINQIDYSISGKVPSKNWITPPNLPAGVPVTPTLEVAFYSGFFDLVPTHPGAYGYNGQKYTNSNLMLQIYTPTRIITNSFSWQANDPLVHYLASDLDYNNGPGLGQISDDNTINFNPGLNLTNLTTPYSPWGQDYHAFSDAQNNGNNQKYVANANYLMTIKDPLVWRSDYWNFPTNKYPTVGWLGRVHRGTPWQTVYLKASDILTMANGLNTWRQWAGDTNAFDATNSAPLADGGLFDLFTTALHPNATHGTLSVNVGAGSADPQAGLAAWSAVFSGIVALTNATASPSATTVPVVNGAIVPPAGANGANSALVTLVNGINSLRAGFVNPDGLTNAFEHIGNLLRSPTLTEQSPFLNWNNPDQQKYGISDELYEWLPQQTFGLLRVTTAPRYVVYCYGQALRPAVNGIVTSAGSFGLVTNYQIVAESAARAVVRMDKHVSGNSTNYTAEVESYNLLPPN